MTISLIVFCFHNITNFNGMVNIFSLSFESCYSIMFMIIVKKKKKCLVVSLPNARDFLHRIRKKDAKLMIASVFPDMCCSGTTALTMFILL